MRRITLYAVTLALVVPLSAVAPTSPASAIDTVITLSRAVGPPTSPLRVFGQGFGASEDVALSFDTDSIGTAVTDPAGAFSASITVPSAATPGTHTVQATGRPSGLSASAPFLVRTDWPKYQFDLGNTGWNRFENVLSTSNVGSLHRLWSIPIGQRPGSPSTGNGLVYFGANDGVMRAVDPATGATAWSTSWHGFSYSAPLVLGPTVYVRQASVFLLAFNALTGRVRWQSPQGGGGTPAAPTSAFGLLFDGSTDGNLYAASPSTGAIVWTFPTGGPIFSAPAIGDGVLYVGSDDHNFYAIDARTGAKLWSVPGGFGSTSSASLAGGVIYAPSYFDSKLYAITANTGTVRWTLPLLSGPGTTAVANGVIYVSDQDQLYAVDAVTGLVLWTAPGVWGTAGAAVANGVLYVESANGILYAFDASNGTVLWNATVGTSELSPPVPVVVNGVVFAASTDTNQAFYAFGL